MLVLLGFGGNLGDVAGSFGTAATSLGHDHVLLAASTLWRTVPVGPPQPDYLNAALLLDVRVPVDTLLETCQGLEGAAGRNREREGHWGPRPLDIDLLMLPGLIVESRRLTLPHARLGARRFALLPACELVPDWTHPRLHRSLRDLLAAIDPATQPCFPGPPFPTQESARQRTGTSANH